MSWSRITDSSAGGGEGVHSFRTFHTAGRTLEGVEVLHMLRKGQVKRLAGRDVQGQAKFVRSLFQVAA